MLKHTSTARSVMSRGRLLDGLSRPFLQRFKRVHNSRSNLHWPLTVEYEVVALEEHTNLYTVDATCKDFQEKFTLGVTGVASALGGVGWVTDQTGESKFWSFASALRTLDQIRRGSDTDVAIKGGNGAVPQTHYVPEREDIEIVTADVIAGLTLETDEDGG